MDQTNMPRSRAIELAAEQVGAIVAAAQESAERIRSEAAAEGGRIRAAAEERARELERDAKRAQAGLLDDGERLRVEGRELRREAREAADELRARTAADEALAEARAVGTAPRERRSRPRDGRRARARDDLEPPSWIGPR